MAGLARAPEPAAASIDTDSPAEPPPSERQQTEIPCARGPARGRRGPGLRRSPGSASCRTAGPVRSRRRGTISSPKPSEEREERRGAARSPPRHQSAKSQARRPARRSSRVAGTTPRNRVACHSGWRPTATATRTRARRFSVGVHRAFLTRHRPVAFDDFRRGTLTAGRRPLIRSTSPRLEQVPASGAALDELRQKRARRAARSPAARRTTGRSAARDNGLETCACRPFHAPPATFSSSR